MKTTDSVTHKSYFTPFSNACARLKKEKWFTNEWDSRVRFYPPDKFDCVALSVMKTNWTNPGDPWAQRSKIFFSFWTVDETLPSNEIRYNIHALKLRLLKEHKIESRNFAEAFRKRFKPLAKKWPNVSVDYGPLTLMEGYIVSPLQECEDAIVAQTRNLPVLARIIDDLLDETIKD